MIQECRILLWVKHFQEGARGVAVDPTTNLVNLIDQYQRVFGADTLQGLDDFAR